MNCKPVQGCIGNIYRFAGVPDAAGFDTADLVTHNLVYASTLKNFNLAFDIFDFDLKLDLLATAVTLKSPLLKPVAAHSPFLHAITAGSVSWWRYAAQTLLPAHFEIDETT